MENTENIHEAIQKSVLPVFLKFTLTNVLSILAISSSGIVDAMFLGRCAGPEAMAAVNIVNPLFSFCFGLAIMLTIGAAVRAGKYIGENNIEKASSIFTKTIVAISLATLAVSVMGIFFSSPLSRFLGANNELLPMSSEYLKIIAFFLIFTTAGFALSVFIRVDGRPTLASAGLITVGAVNMLLDFLFIDVLDMGVKGAAIATGTAGAAGFLVLISHFIMGKSKINILFDKHGWSELPSAAYNGFSEFISEMSAGIIMLSFNHIMISRFGTQGAAAFAAVNYLIWGGIMINYATADSLNPLISINYGAKKPDRIMSFIRLAFGFVFFNGFVIFTLLTVMPDTLIGIFITDKNSETFNIALEFAFYVRWTFFMNGFNQIFSAYFTAVQRPLESAAVSSLRGLALPLFFLAILPYLLGGFGIFIAIPASEAVTLIAALFMWKHNKPSKFIMNE